MKTLLKIKPYREKPGFCGPASLKMVLGYYGIEKGEKELGRITRCNSKLGTKASSIVRIAKKIGFRSLYKDYANFADIRKFVVEQKIPVIVDWFSEDNGHYSVVVGIDGRNIYLQDPELGALKIIDLKTFKRVWFDFEGDFLKSKRDIIIRRMIVIYK